MKLAEVQKAVVIWGVISQSAVQQLKQSANLVVVPEHRPFMLGLKRNCPGLKRENIKFVYCNDNSLGLLFYKGKIIKTMIFFKEKKDEGFVCPAGSLYAALLSKLHKVPVEMLQQDNVPAGLFDGEPAVLAGKSYILPADHANYIVNPVDELLNKELK